ncbi:protein PAT1 2 [Clarias magur]|uniref:Protein PAT1 2 n=1 Tax=Clarias magur TaxID=1594786 RepID=A0A8J4WT93_CLAMG|nr:protein PAT1 2 [Clarias magur]
MSDSENPEDKGDSVPEAKWPENGDQWSDGEDIEESGLIQEMVEEDEDIDLYNEETFGLDINAEDLDADPVDLLLLEGNQPSSPHPPSPQEASPPRHKVEIKPQAPAGLSEKFRSRRERVSKGQLLDDPAVMRTVEGPPSLKSLDSAIVDCGRSSGWGDLNANTWMISPYGPTRQAPLLQDKAIVRVIDRSSRGRMSFASPLPRALPQQSSMCPLITRSPLRPQSPFSIKQHYNQPGIYLSPSTPRFHSPKMMPLQFGPNSPRPGPCFSPLPGSPSQRFRFPVLATQLHPQHKRLLSQRPQGFRRKPKDWDHYAEIMSAKEKEWIIKLQMIQLQSENPHQDDYYYQEYYRRLETKLAEEEMLGDRSKREPPKLTTPYVTKTVSYTPVVHIEGSLGQVAVSTCYSPRRAIDAVHGHTVEEQKDIRQQRLEVLSTIEKCYVILLGVEEAERAKASVSDEEERQRRLKTIQGGVEQISSQLCNPGFLESTEEFLPCLLVAKGKKLLARLLPFLSSDASLQVLRAITTHLPVLMSRDADEALPVLYPCLRAVISTLTFTQLVSILRDFTTALPDSKDSRLTLACQNKFGLSLLYVLLSQARQLSRSSLIEPLCLPSNLLTLFCRYLDKRTVQQLKNNMESSTGYLAVGS